MHCHYVEHGGLFLTIDSIFARRRSAYCFHPNGANVSSSFFMLNIKSYKVPAIKTVRYTISRRYSFRSERVTLLKRTCLLMCHEISHMFGLSHCIYYHCLMNGSNNFEESDAKPLRMCPVCLRKLQFVCKFDVVPRYEALASFCHDNGMTHEANWFSTRLEQIRR